MRTLVTLSSKNQIVIPQVSPQEIIDRSGDPLILNVEKDNLILKPKPKSYSKHLRGLHRAIWQGVDAADYVRKERETWEDK